ncbi:MAG: ATP-binding protein [Bacteroidetes bacterium]|nr:ATP-binding protein [Bacteroidota bacterium]
MAARTLLSALMLLTAWSLPAQEYTLNFERISTKEGLPHTTVYSLLQDQTGFMWIGTENGLVRYDGLNLKVWISDPENQDGLAGSNISSIALDGNGNLVLGLWGEGLNIFNPKTEKFTRYSQDPADPTSLNDNRAQVVFVDSKDRIWIGTYRGGLNRFLPDQKKFLSYMTLPGQHNSISSNRIWAIGESADGMLWLGTDEGLNRFDPENGTFSQPELPKGPAGKSLQVRAVYPEKTGQIWLGTDNGLMLYNPATGETKVWLAGTGRSSSTENVINRILEDASGNLWIATYERGLIRFIPQKNKFVPYLADPANPNALASNDIRCLYQDRSGTIWTGGRGGSLARFNLIARKFNYISTNPNNSNSLTDNNVTTISQSADGHLWMGTNGYGVNEYNPDKDLYTHFSAEKSGIGSNFIQTLYPTDETVWIGTRNGGLSKLDRRTGKSRVVGGKPGEPVPFTNNTIRAILPDKPGFLWVGTKTSGLHLMDIRKETFRSFRSQATIPGSISGTDIRCLYRTRNGVLYIGTDGGGLNRFNPMDSTFSSWKSIPGNTETLTNNDVVCLWEDSTGFLWVGTDGGGLNRFDPVRETFENMSRKIPLASAIIYGLQGDDSGNLWIQTINGLSRVDLKTLAVRNYLANDGLQSSMFNQNSCYKAASGELFFGGINGITSLFPGQIRDNAFIPAITLTSFEVFNKPLQTDTAVAFLKVITLDHTQNFFSFQFAALDFVNPENNQFRYKLEGFDEDWIDCGTRKFASYTNLDGGEYTLRVVGSNNDGLWNETGISVKLIVLPPFWQTWWFRLILLALLAGGVWLAIRIRTRLVRNHNRLLEREIEERTRELQEKNQTLEITLTNLKTAQTHLFQQEKMASLGTLVAGVAHEINNPVNFIHTSIHPLNRDFSELTKTLHELLELHNELIYLRANGTAADLGTVIDKLGNEDRISHIQELENEIAILLKGIETGSTRTAEIVKSLRTFTRLDENTWKLFNLHDGLDSTIQILTPKWKNQVTIHRNYGDLPEVECYPGQINQVFMNLLVNAFDALDSGGEVTISSRLTGGKAEIRIRDTGCGISKEAQSRIFEPFFTTKPVGKGTGLGLAISYSVISRHNGEIRVSSEPGKGTEFTILLPVIQTTDTKPGSEEEKSPA